LVSRITFSSARFWSLSTSASDFMEVNQILGSPGLGLYSPLAIASSRARIRAWAQDADGDGLHSLISFNQRPLQPEPPIAVLLLGIQ